MDIGEFENMLSDLADELPEYIFEGLNGGIVISEKEKQNTASKDGNLYIMGEYHNDCIMGRFIVIYYGSFEKLYVGCDKAVIREKAREVLRHEFEHHAEGLAGERGLMDKDEQWIREYLAAHADKNNE